MTQFFSHYSFFPLPPEALFNIAGPDTEDGAADAGVSTTMRQRLIAIGKVTYAPIENPAAYYDPATGCMVFQMPPPGYIDFDMITREAGWHGDREGVARELAAAYETARAEGADDGLLAWFNRSKELLNFPTMPEGATDVDADTRELGPQQG